MENKNLVRVKLWSDRKHYQVIEIREDEVEKVREANRMTWRELDKEIRRRKKLEEENITICSFESLDEDGTWIPDESLNAEEKIIAEETKFERNVILADAIRKLEPRQQEMIKMVFFEGKSQNEVATRFGIKKAATSDAMHRIYASLKKIIEEN